MNVIQPLFLSSLYFQIPTFLDWIFAFQFLLQIFPLTPLPRRSFPRSAPKLKQQHSDQICFVGVQLVIQSNSKFLPYQILLNTPHHSCTPTKQTWSQHCRVVVNEETSNYTEFSLIVEAGSSLGTITSYMFSDYNFR